MQPARGPAGQPASRLPGQQASEPAGQPAGRPASHPATQPAGQPAIKAQKRQPFARFEQNATFHHNFTRKKLKYTFYIKFMHVFGTGKRRGAQAA